MRDVARAAGVSHQTVSRVLNEPDLVRSETRDRVLAVMRDLGYRRNLAARALASGHSALIGVVWTGADFFGPSRTVAGIEVAARSAGYATLVGALPADQEDAVASIIESFRDRSVDGVAVVAPHQRMFDLVRDRLEGIPTVMVGDLSPEECGCHTVSIDQQLGAELAVRHLIETGARSIAHVTGPLDWFDAAARVRGWRSALGDAGLELLDPIVGDWTPESGYAAGKTLADDLPDAVFCANDLMAVGLAAALGPDVSRVRLVGFDDIDGSAFFSPPLTTVHQPFEALGALSLETLMSVMAGEDPRPRKLAPELVIRASSSPAA
ncbi:LacI family DNA-binding transcriptional regulator [Tessaracoccus flavus]|uniref:HTH lacI-type domain-containing protein n=1 Tax=Tessaracoccus flavus TaxID=1610493 RepID=A0A1Q2CFL1_9ACTN|nr:LacI family DNA-binding transcriptional regulator [Tessaracoccus flavus]AQP44906.1 hypothetical protein RPIT_08970 [Tessaracoccus flavus]